MAFYNFDQLVAAIKGEAQVTDSTTWATIIGQLVNSSLLHIILRDRPHEYMRNGITATLSAAIEQDLPADYWAMERVEYAPVSPASTPYWELFSRDLPAPPALIFGKCRSYEIGVKTSDKQTPCIIFSPTQSNNDLAKYDYIYKPSLLTGNATIHLDRAIPEIKGSVLQQLQIIRDKPASELAQFITEMNKQLTAATQSSGK